MEKLIQCQSPTTSICPLPPPWKNSWNQYCSFYWLITAKVLVHLNHLYAGAESTAARVRMPSLGHGHLLPPLHCQLHGPELCQKTRWRAGSQKTELL